MKSTPVQYIKLSILLFIIFFGLFYPLIGYFVLAMMIFFITLSFYKGRFWCWYLCPRGAFLEVVVGGISFRGSIPYVFRTAWFKYLVFILIMGVFIYRLVMTRDVYTIGYLFVTMCLVTTILAVLIGIPTKPRGWCTICPMGTMQELVHGLNNDKCCGKILNAKGGK